MGILSRTRDNKKTSGLFDKLKGKVKSGLKTAQTSAQERRIHRDEINIIRKNERVKQEKKHTRFEVQEEYRQKRKEVRSGGGRGKELDNLFMGGGGFSLGGGSGDSMADLILGKPEKPKRKPRKKKRNKKNKK